MLKDPFFGAELPAAFPKSEKRPVVAKLGILNFYVCEWDGREAESFEVEGGGGYFDRHNYIDMSPSRDPNWNYLYTYTSDSASRNIIFATRVKAKESVFSHEKILILGQRTVVSQEVDDKLGGIPCSRCKVIIDYTFEDADIQTPLCLQCSASYPIMGLFALDPTDYGA